MSINAVVPDGSSVSNVGQQGVRSRAAQIFKGALQLRRCFKMSHLGKYSSERVKKLNSYCQNTPLLRVILVEVLIPWPALLLELVAECIPLQNPTDGWKRNYGAWCRLWLVIAATSAGSLFEVRASTPELTYAKIVGITMGTACGSTSMMILVASVWMYPIPFSIFLSGILGAPFLVGLFIISIKMDERNINSKLDNKLNQKMLLVVAQLIPAAVYLTFSVVFTRSTPHLRFGLLLLLPTIKLILKRMIARLASNDKESIPAVVVFSVDVFDGLYTSICMQSSDSWATALFIIGMSFFYTMSCVLEINRAARALHSLGTTNILLPWRKQLSSRISLAGSARCRTVTRNANCQVHVQTTPPEQSIEVPRSVNTSYSAQPASVSEIKASKLLFYLEYQVLSAYIKGAIPLVYATYLMILVNLPSAQFYPHARDLTPSQLQTTVGSIVAYAIVEFLSFAWLQIVVERKLGFSLLYQLAFVLETEMELIQGRLFVWIIILLQFSLVHFGTLIL
ncbi:hypothetical protein ON010_g4894 [Phytophthora cinnamomi]|nr:hypothetical protein ON010_g4894 [Phytophthora cinnamomi]